MFYNGDGRKVHCAVSLDTKAGNAETIDEGLDRAVERGEVLEVYAHRPRITVDVADIEKVLAGARTRGLPFVTYADFAARDDVRPGVALSFDDASVDLWFEIRDLFKAYDARVTFFVSRYTAIPAFHDMLRELANDGHDIAAHSVLHLRAPSYVEEHGLQAYLEDEAVPSIQVLRDAGYNVTSFAYPFGARTDELDDALLEHVSVLRSVSFTLEGAPDPCPH